MRPNGDASRMSRATWKKPDRAGNRGGCKGVPPIGPPQIDGLTTFQPLTSAWFRAAAGGASANGGAAGIHPHRLNPTFAQGTTSTLEAVGNAPPGLALKVLGAINRVSKRSYHVLAFCDEDF